ncbi:response regulator [Candidatus Dojkabacteria bacterium]|nr:response regulator [Candidatus Dojkabacteria bacterium]
MTGEQEPEETGEKLKQATHIAIVNDEPEMSDLISHALRKGGFTNVTKHERNIGLIEEWRNDGGLPGLIFIDMMMPQRSGVEFLQELLSFCEAQRVQKPKIIFLDSAGTPAMREAVSKIQDQEGHENVGHIVLPFQHRELLATVRGVLGMK